MHLCPDGKHPSCNPKIIVQPLSDGRHQSQGLRWRNKAGQPCPVHGPLPSGLPMGAEHLGLSTTQSWPTCHCAPPSAGHMPTHFQPLGQLQGAPPAPEVGPYPAAPLHPFPFVLKGRGNGPGINSTQGILAMPSYPGREPHACFPFIARLFAYFCNEGECPVEGFLKLSYG